MRWFSCLFVLTVLWMSCQPVATGPKSDSSSKKTHSSLPFDPGGELVYTKHARCRMDCRHITAKEIHEILDSGTLNMQKSDPNGRPDPKYAVDGFTTEQQHLRVVVAPERNKLIVITCIELNVEWTCHCN